MIRNKTSRHDPCQCGSGLKYKQCCLESKQIKSGDLLLHPAQPKLKQKTKDHLSQKSKLQTDLQAIKMSEVILEFAADMLRHSDTRTERKQAIDFACMAWNLAIFKEKDPAEYKRQLNSFFKQIGAKSQNDKKEVQLLITALVNKKMKQYPLINRFIFHYQIKFKKNELILHVASAFSSTETDGITQEGD